MLVVPPRHLPILVGERQSFDTLTMWASNDVAVNGEPGPDDHRRGGAVARLAKQVEVALTPLDLSLPQYRVLALLGEGSTASSVLARRLAVSPPSVTVVVDGLVGRGLVERQADPEDRRRLTLLLTRDGAKLLVAADAAAEARLDEIAAFFDDAADRPRRLESRARPQSGSAPGAGQVTIEMGAFGADVTSPFVPIGVTPDYPPPCGNIAPKRDGDAMGEEGGGKSTSWIRRMLPIVLAHKWMFGFSLLCRSSGSRCRCRSPTRSGRRSTR